MKITVLLFLAVCSLEVAESALQMQLADGSSVYEGRLEIWFNGRWATVCGNGWDIQDANVVCKELGYAGASEAFSNSDVFGEGSGPIILENVDCRGTESSLTQCPNDGWGVHNCTHSRDAGVRCTETETIRLVNGTNNLEGRLEVMYADTWGTVCDDNWNSVNSDVACRQLGFGGSSAFYGNARFGQGSGYIMLDDVRCTGDEQAISECRHSGWGVHNCDHSEDVSVVCYNLLTTEVARQTRVWTDATDGDFTTRHYDDLTTAHQDGDLTTLNQDGDLTTRQYEDLTTPHQDEDILADVQCDDAYMTILVGDSSLIDHSNFPPHLLNISCISFGQVNKDGVSWLLFITRYDRCGTQVQFSDNYVEYSNAVILKRKGESNIISREHELVIPVKCKLKNSGKSSINFDPQEVSLIGDAVENDGNFSFALDMYQEGSFNLPYGSNDYPVIVDIGQTIYLGAHVTSYTGDVKLYIDSCVATTSSDASTSPRYDLIQDSCPSDDTTSFAESRGDNQNVYFQLDAFRFVQGQYLVYVHCEMSLCNATDPTCTRTCGQRNRRSPMSLFKTEKLSKGPLFLRHVDSETNEVSQAKSSTISEDRSNSLLITSVFFVMNFLLIVGIAVYVVKRSQPVQTTNHYQPLLQDIE